MKTRFDEQVDQLNAQMIEMGAMIETTIEDACTALQNADLPKARAIIEADSTVDRKERERDLLRLDWRLRRGQPDLHGYSGRYPHHQGYLPHALQVGLAHLRTWDGNSQSGGVHFPGWHRGYADCCPGGWR